jgi:CspA family cold shock protein
MSKYRNHRQGRNRGLESDGNIEISEPAYFQRRPLVAVPDVSATAAAFDAEVLWLNVDKAFGFVRLSDGTEAFLHASKVQAFGHQSLPPGTHLKVMTGPGQKGPQVVEVLSVDLDGANTATNASPPRIVKNGTPQSEEPLGQEAPGVVKTYDAKKGYGFIKIADGAEVFVHATAISRSGIETIAPGETVIVRYIQAQKGLEAHSLRPV